jgi:hypothetical protein
MNQKLHPFFVGVKLSDENESLELNSSEGDEVILCYKLSNKQMQYLLIFMILPQCNKDS